MLNHLLENFSSDSSKHTIKFHKSNAEPAWLFMGLLKTRLTVFVRMGMILAVVVLAMDKLMGQENTLLLIPAPLWAIVGGKR